MQINWINGLDVGSDRKRDCSTLCEYATLTEKQRETDVGIIGIRNTEAINNTHGWHMHSITILWAIKYCTLLFLQYFAKLCSALIIYGAKIHKWICYHMHVWYSLY